MEEFSIWQGVIQFSRDDGIRWNHYFMNREKPIYDSLQRSKLEGISIDEFYWHNEPTTQGNLDKKVTNLAYLPPVRMDEISKALNRFVVPGMRIGSKEALPQDSKE